MTVQPPAPTPPPISQEKPNFRKRLPEWIRQLPQRKMPPNDPNFQLIDPEKLLELLTGVEGTPLEDAAIARLQEDMKFLEKELLTLFRDLDYNAKLQQNMYRQYQVSYMVLAAVATLLGSLLAVSLKDAPQLVPWFGFGETAVALFTAYLATISGREPPLPKWLASRSRAEHMRREYFRYLMDLAPYDELEGYERRHTLSIRAANINRGFFPETQSSATPGK